MFFLPDALLIQVHKIPLNNVFLDWKAIKVKISSLKEAKFFTASRAINSIKISLYFFFVPPHYFPIPVYLKVSHLFINNIFIAATVFGQ